MRYGNGRILLHMLPFVLSTVLIIILFVEWCLWLLFRRKSNGLVFPVASDASSFRIFTMPRMKFLAVLHTVALCVTCGCFLFFLW